MIAVPHLRFMSHPPLLLLVVLLDVDVDVVVLELVTVLVPPVPMSPPVPPLPSITQAVKLAVPKQAAVTAPKTTAKVRMFIR